MYYLLLLFTPLILYTLEVVESLKKNNDLRTFFNSFHYLICLFIMQFKYKGF